ncbi:MAG: methyltransferase type 11 [Rhodospirillaceae bacterium]|nr:methyltransferase type 11 [Alphaproteobacteria bacterium]MBR71856.1 methyltransferase type 11 [Rhodospirillaceae bacterium]|tara:strand:+ start:2858 stop:3481 length:624 start_codon:yes stop_codon:yes gene_type:complete
MKNNKQLEFWRGEFGDLYIGRNTPEDVVYPSRVEMWKKILSVFPDLPSSILEVGSNIGNNLKILDQLLDVEIYALEPNAKARETLKKNIEITEDKIFNGSAKDLPIDSSKIDLVFTSGVLIHIAPEDLQSSCAEIYRVSRRYILSIEYFNPTPIQIPYRGHDGVLFKRDFGSFWIENFPNLKVIDYGFFWKPQTGLDNLTWWLFQKP